uniref:Elongation of very long chain fatty acids protein n=1 Tax=Panagrolaimus sp. PS1159 TaxID=55785 RepID=A0AC35GD18_9BILA
MFEKVNSVFDRNISRLPLATVRYDHQFVLPFEHSLDHVRITYLMQTYWHLTVYLGIFYLISMKWLQKWMESRSPYNLKGALIAWNGGLAIFSILGALRTSEEFIHTVKEEGLYTSLCQCFDPPTVVGHWFLFFGISKIVELGDTVFLVLKKKPLSFLHCWHHFSVMIYTFHSGSEYLAAGRWFMWMNFIAHSLMYSYFTIMAMGYKVSRSFARIVTIVQILQMIIGVSVSFAVLTIKKYL